MVCARVHEQREKAAKKETNKHKNGSLSPVRSSYVLPNLRLTISKFSNFPQKCCQTCRRPGKAKDLVLWRIFAHHLPKTIETTQVSAKKKKKERKKKCCELLDLVALTSSPSWMETSFAPAFCYKGWDGRECKAQRTVPNGYKSGFPQWITCFKKIRPDQYFSREKKPLCDADESRQETCWDQWSPRLCAEVQSTQAGKQRSYTVIDCIKHGRGFCDVTHRTLWSSVTVTPAAVGSARLHRTPG